MSNLWLRHRGHLMDKAMSHSWSTSGKCGADDEKEFRDPAFRLVVN
eukprot:gene17823-3461_t